MIKQQVFVEENMSNLTSAVSGEASVSSTNNRGDPSNSFYPLQQQQQQQYISQHQQNLSEEELPQQPPAKKKRNLPGNPDPDAEVIALSPKALLATNRFVCEICNKGFQRDQNLQLHRRGHNLPWKLKQRTNKEVKKKVYVCPEVSCVHHDPSRALGDLTGIKKHFCRKHGEKKWKCDKCSKRYAVQSDWKAHSKVCGTREYRCDCGTLFSRRDSFITHRAFCDALAEETARSITTNSSLLSSNPIPVSGSHINLQQQQQQQQQDPLHAYPLKREQHQHQNLINLPPWLACPPIDPSPSSSSSIFQHQNDHNQMMQHRSPSSNPSNPNMGPTIASSSLGCGTGGIGGAYHTQVGSPHMSATALLQKAAQMGATMSNTSAVSQPHHHHQQQLSQHHQSHVSDTHSTAGLFGLNLSSRDQQQQQEIMTINTTSSGLMVNNCNLSSFENKAATPTTPTTTPIGVSGPSPSPNQGPPPQPQSSIFHDMMVNSLSSTYDHDDDDDAFGIGGMAMMGTSNSKKDSSSLPAFHQSFNPRGDDGHGNGNGSNGNGGNGNHGGGNSEGLTRDFLGLRPLSHNDILTIAGLGTCMTTTNATSHHHQQQQQQQQQQQHDHHQQQSSHTKSWQG